MVYLKGLFDILVSRGMSQADLCRISGLSSGVISSYINGRRVPSIIGAIRIADSLGVTLDELIGREPVLYTPPPPLAKDEDTLLENYRKCTQKNKDKVSEYAEFQSAKSKESTRNSKRSKRSA